MPPLVSVVIATFNRADLIRRAIDSVLQQSYPATELVIVDDGSTDDTPTVLAQYSERISVVRQENRERGAARNAGIRASSGELISFLDSDDEYSPEHVEGLVAAFQAAPQVGFGYRQAALIDSQGRQFYIAPPKPLEGDIFREVSIENHFAFSSVMVRRSLLEKVGGFDEDRELAGCEDWELWVRCLAASPALFVPGVTVLNHFHGANTVGNPATMERALRLAEQRILSTPITRRRLASERELQAHVITVIARYYRTAGDSSTARKKVVAEVRSRPRLLTSPRMLKTLARVLV